MPDGSIMKDDDKSMKEEVEEPTGLMARRK